MHRVVLLNFFFCSVCFTEMASSVVLSAQGVDEILPSDGRRFLGEMSDGEEEKDDEVEEGEEEQEDRNAWYLFGRVLPKNEVIFVCQVVILYVVIVTCIVNLSLKNGDSNLWTALLSSSLGIMLPQPTLSSTAKKSYF